jgi:D-galactarolactone cycloisomerase
LSARALDRIQSRPARQFIVMSASRGRIAGPSTTAIAIQGRTMPSSRAAGLPPFRITRIAAAPLFGESPKGGWSAEIRPEDSIHAIIAVHTDQGLTGYGSVFTDGRLVQAALKVLEPLYRDEDALTPERVSEKLHQNTFWMGRGGTLTHTISGIDIALWDILGQATGLSVGRLLGGGLRTRTQPYCSLLMEEPQAMSDVVAKYRERGFTAFKIGWGPFGRALDAKLDEAIVRAAREAAGASSKLFVDAGASDALWPHGFKWAKRTAEMLKDFNVGWFEEPVRPDAIDDYCELRRCSPVAIAGCEVLTRRQSFVRGSRAAPLTSCSPTSPRSGAFPSSEICRARLEHGARRCSGSADGVRLPRRRSGRIHRRKPLRRRHPR